MIREIVEDILTKKPYVEHLVVLLLKDQNIEHLEDIKVKLFRSCLRSLTSEDLMHLGWSKDSKDLMMDLAIQFNEYKQGSNELNNEKDKIIKRFEKESMPIHWVSKTVFSHPENRI